MISSTHVLPPPLQYTVSVTVEYDPTSSPTKEIHDGTNMHRLHASKENKCYIPSLHEHA